MKNNRRISIVSTWHYIRLVYRSVLFVLLLISYIRYKLFSGAPVIERVERIPTVIYVTWLVFVVEMIMRFFPSQYESPGCQKQFARNYIKSGSTEIVIADNNSTVLIALIWIVFNGIFGALNMAGVLDDGVMVLLCSVYSICDIICILFFCPFQTWFMKNKCCSTCRIYNWDYAMMFMPLFFIRKTYTWSLLALSVALVGDHVLPASGAVFGEDERLPAVRELHGEAVRAQDAAEVAVEADRRVFREEDREVEEVKNDPGGKSPQGSICQKGVLL